STLARVAVLFDPLPGRQRQQVETTASRLGLKLVTLEARNRDDIDRAFERAARERVGGIVVVASPLFAEHKTQIVVVAEKHRIPAMYEHRVFVERGACIPSGPALRALCGRPAIYVQKPLKATSPADLPVEEPTTFELVTNLKTAKAPWPDDPPVAAGTSRSGDRIVRRR